MYVCMIFLCKCNACMQLFSAYANAFTSGVTLGTNAADDGHGVSYLYTTSTGTTITTTTTTTFSSQFCLSPWPEKERTLGIECWFRVTLNFFKRPLNSFLSSCVPLCIAYCW